MIENEKNIENQKKSSEIEKNEKSKKGQDFVQYLENEYLRSHKKVKAIKRTKRIFKLASLAACLVATTLFFGALIDKNSARSEFKKTQEYNSIVRENSAEIYQKFENEEISSYEYIQETKSLASNSFVDKQIETSTENLGLKRQYQNHKVKNLAGTCSLVGAIGLASSKFFLNKKLAKAAVEENSYRKFFF